MSLATVKERGNKTIQWKPAKHHMLVYPRFRPNDNLLDDMQALLRILSSLNVKE